jgi:hypothetical protein
MDRLKRVVSKAGVLENVENVVVKKSQSEQVKPKTKQKRGTSRAAQQNRRKQSTSPHDDPNMSESVSKMQPRPIILIIDCTG